MINLPSVIHRVLFAVVAGIFSEKIAKNTIGKLSDKDITIFTNINVKSVFASRFFYIGLALVGYAAYQAWHTGGDAQTIFDAALGVTIMILRKFTNTGVSGELPKPETVLDELDEIIEDVFDEVSDDEDTPIIIR